MAHVPLVSVKDARHADVESRVAKWLKAHRFLVERATYHDCFSPEAVLKLRNMWCPTALNLRGRADKVAIRPPCVFEYEAKTGSGDNISIEALPLARHVSEARLGVQCLYVLESEVHRSRGFWCTDVPEFSGPFIPPQPGRPGLVEFYERRLQEAFGRKPVRCQQTKGSGDPFVLVKGEALSQLDSWQALLAEVIAKLDAEEA
jgi:hypothetical protein